MQNVDFGQILSFLCRRASTKRHVTSRPMVRFSQTWYQKMRKTWKKKLMNKACRDLQRSRGSHGFRIGGGGPIDPPVKIVKFPGPPPKMASEIRMLGNFLDPNAFQLIRNKETELYVTKISYYFIFVCVCFEGIRMTPSEEIWNYFQLHSIAFDFVTCLLKLQWAKIFCLTLIPLGYFEDSSPLGGGGGGGGGLFWPPPPLRSRQLVDRLTWKLAQS